MAPATEPYHWQQGQGWTRLTPAAGSACFLTKMQGKFEGNSESIRIVPAYASWWLGGSSDEHGVEASAVCVPTGMSTTHEFVRSLSRGFTQMDNKDSSCFLTMVSGDFDGWEDAVSINIGHEYHQLSTTVSSLGGSRKKMVGARCMRGLRYPVQAEHYQLLNYSPHAFLVLTRLC